MKKLKRKVLSVILALTMVIGLLPATVVTARAEDVIEVSDQAGLKAIESAGGTYKLTADITLDSWTAFYPAGGFTLDGNGHTITFTGTKLFENIPGDSVVKNLVLKGEVSETGRKNTGALAGSCSGTIRNCASSVNVTYTGDSPNIYLGGLSGKVTGTISNCLVTGSVMNTGNAQCYGSISNIAFFESGTIKNCVAVGCDRIGSEEGWSGSTVISGTNCTLISDASDFNPADYVDVLNANLQDGDLSWSVEDGVLAPRSSSEEIPDPDATEEEINALEDAITAAEAVDKSKVYTTESWSVFGSALTEAKKVRDAEDKKQSKVIKVTSDLTSAQTGLVEKTLSAVDLSDKEVISITAEYQLENLQAGKYYRLDADITLGNYWFGTFYTMNGVLDGNGHTITLNGSPLWAGIGSNGVVQNLGIIGSAESTNDTGAIAADCQGLIINCWSRAEIKSEGQNGILKNTGGFVANLKSGGVIVNSYVAGTVTAKGSTGTGVAGAIAGTAASNTMIKNCYWLNTVNEKAANGGNCVDCAAKTREEFYSDSLLSLLNSNKGENSKAWTINDEGWPHLGEAGSFTPPEPAELAYTSYEGYGSCETPFNESQGLVLSLAEVLPDPGAEINYYVGKFTYPGYSGEIEWQGQYVSSGQGNHKVFVSAEGELQVLGAGSLDIVAYDKNTWEKLAAFTVTVSDIQAEEIRIIPDGKYVSEEDGTYKVAGSGIVTLNTEIKVDGQWKSAPSSLFDFELDGKVFTSGGNTFYATEPGEINVSVSGLGKTSSEKITSTYVPVTSIAPAVSGTYVIHGRNANSDSLGNFLDLMLSSGAGTVSVAPENASYRDSWTLTSSDPDIAEYVSSFLLAVLPKKAGTVTFTAASSDPYLQSPVFGISTITLEYLNPLTNVSIDDSEALTVSENETIVLPLTFTGSEGKEDYHVTEPGMTWTFSGEGEVSITRSPLGEILAEDSNEYCVATTEYKLTGEKAGTVTVKGTPIDTTGGAEPITFTVTVEAGDPETAADIDKIVSGGVKDSTNVIQKAYQEYPYEYGDEWAVFILTRSGTSLTSSEISHYLESVVNTYTNPKSSALKPTTLARVALTVSVLGEDASDLDGINLIKLLCNSKMISDGSNEAAWALIALDSCDYEIPEGSLWSRETLIDTVLSFQAENGGFGLLNNLSSDVDMTAMCIQSLAPYYNSNEKVKEAVDAALDYLKEQMDRNCDLGSSESISQVIIALAALDIDPLDMDNGFAKSVARNLLSALDAYHVEGSGFKHLSSDAEVNNMASIQAMQALVAYDRYRQDKTSLYDLTGAAEEKPAPAEPDTSYDVSIIVPAVPDSAADKVTVGVSEDAKNTVDQTIAEIITEILSGNTKPSGIDETTAANMKGAISSGEDISVQIVVDEIVSADEIDVKAKNDIIAIVSREDGQVVQYLDLSVVIKNAAGDTLGNITELKAPITVVVTIPEDMRAEGRTFFIIRYHDGVAEKLETTDNGDGTVSFETDKFSIYALAYTDDNSTALADTGKQNHTESDKTQIKGTAKTGDDSPTWMLFLIVVAACGCFAGGFAYRRKVR